MTMESKLQESMLGQPPHVTDLAADARDNLIISMRKVNGRWIVVSRYGDTVWKFTPSTTNVRLTSSQLDFDAIPESFRAAIKAVMYRYMRRGLGGRPAATQLKKTFNYIVPFCEFLLTVGVTRFADVTEFTAATYIQSVRQPRDWRQFGKVRVTVPGMKRYLALGTQSAHFAAVEALYELSQFSADPMQRHPWPGSTAESLSGASRDKRASGSKTPLIPDDIFVALFQKAWTIVENADALLDIRDALDVAANTGRPVSVDGMWGRKVKRLAKLDWSQNLREFEHQVADIRTACYIVIASLSGCRNHEIAYLRTGSFYSTEDDDGERFWWMRSKSTKTDEGDTEWMVPEAVVIALRTMERWAEPYQHELQREIASRRAIDESDVEIAVAQEHIGALFVGRDKTHNNRIRTNSGAHWNLLLKSFVTKAGLEWNLATHQFRRKFANYAARSQFGDLRYLRQHFKHWTQDMTLGYAMNEAQEMTLYFDIEAELDDIKQEVVSSWLDDGKALAGGYGKRLEDWRGRSESVVFFKTRAQMVRAIAESTAIRSNGHAWCTADDNQCIGNDLDRTRCGDDCDNAVIGELHVPIYQGMLDHLVELAKADDIGEGGRQRVERDLRRCRHVLSNLGAEAKA